MVEEGEGVAWIWVLERVGQEPLALMHLVLLHLAEQCIEGPLSDHKGITDGVLGWGRKWILGCGML